MWSRRVRRRGEGSDGRPRSVIPGVDGITAFRHPDAGPPSDRYPGSCLRMQPEGLGTTGFKEPVVQTVESV